ncbi:hypothetical protein DERF_014196 [Dermatophagoides farinae]|uniref:Uncharacterized protein n=1 Tax=Dermatophagoides farinae TaxID=6954 RepID=A0A922L127_DERFA|nr:hypothetical protein DERF_014196 [Dermatophagoides farinae]
MNPANYSAVFNDVELNIDKIIIIVPISGYTIQITSRKKEQEIRFWQIATRSFIVVDEEKKGNNPIIVSEG